MKMLNKYLHVFKKSQATILSQLDEYEKAYSPLRDGAAALFWEKAIMDCEAILGKSLVDSHTKSTGTMRKDTGRILDEEM